MQPGMPQGFGVLGPDRTPIFTLPGNPVSAYVSFLLFVRPALAALQGLSPQRQTGWSVPPSPPACGRRAGRRSYLRGVLDRRRETVIPLTGQSSHQLGALAQANALIIVPEQVTRLERRRRRGRNVPAMTDARLRWPGRTGAAAERALTHLDQAGHARMVDVSGKDVTARQARASGRVLLSARGGRGAAGGRRCPRATRSRWPGSPGSRARRGPRT